jgi:hypothetical protein
MIALPRLVSSVFSRRLGLHHVGPGARFVGHGALQRCFGRFQFSLGRHLAAGKLGDLAHAC